jgi:hypothetical protein
LVLVVLLVQEEVLDLDQGQMVQHLFSQTQAIHQRIFLLRVVAQVEEMFQVVH